MSLLLNELLCPISEQPNEAQSWHRLPQSFLVRRGCCLLTASLCGTVRFLSMSCAPQFLTIVHLYQDEGEGLCCVGLS